MGRVLSHIQEQWIHLAYKISTCSQSISKALPTMKLAWNDLCNECNQRYRWTQQQLPLKRSKEELSKTKTYMMWSWKMQLHFINPTINSRNLVLLVDWHNESHNQFSLWIHQILIFSYEYQFSIFLFMKLYIYTHIYPQFPLALLSRNRNNSTMISQAKCYYVFLASECTCTSCINLGYVGMSESGCRPIRSRHP